MFGHRYFGVRYFGPRYFGPGGGAPPLTDKTFNCRDRDDDTDFDVHEGTGVAFETV